MSADPKAYVGLRMAALAEGKESKQVNTIVADLFLAKDATVTMALRRNGECSIYLSSGGGYLGIHSWPEVKMHTLQTFKLWDSVE